MLKKVCRPLSPRCGRWQNCLGAEQPELDRLEGILTELLAQFYIKTATYSLNQWEQDFGIAENPELTQEQRRAQVLAKLNMRMSATVKMLENLVRQTVGAENVWIEEHPAEYAFTVYVQEDKLSDFLGIARRAVHDARPAHLNYKFIERLIRNARLDLYGGRVWADHSHVGVGGGHQRAVFGAACRRLRDIHFGAAGGGEYGMKYVLTASGERYLARVNAQMIRMHLVRVEVGERRVGCTRKAGSPAGCKAALTD